MKQLVDVTWNSSAREVKDSKYNIGCAGDGGRKQARFTMAVSGVGRHILYKSDQICLEGFTLLRTS